MSVSAKFKGLFWTAGAPSAPRIAQAPDAAPVPTAGAPAGGQPAVVDFAALYARTDTLGDPKCDQVLAAFESMKAAMPAPQLAVAVTATASAIGADPARVAEVLVKRV